MSGYRRQYLSDGRDFFAYYRAAERFAQGLSPYFYTKDFAFKYAPVSVLIYLPFTLLRYETARWVYLLLHCFVVVASPWLALKIIQHSSSIKWSWKELAISQLVSLMATLRFIDGEFQVSQSGISLLFLILLGLRAIQGLSGRLRFIGVFLVGLGGITKIHSISLFSLFTKNIKSVWLSALVMVPLILLPKPTLWFDWWVQTQQTYRDLPMHPPEYQFQGIYPLSMWAFGFDQFSIQPLLLWLGLFVVVWWLLPKFDLFDWVSRSESLMMSLIALMATTLIGSPLPWHYTFSVFWVFLFVSYLLANPNEKKVLIAVSLVLGLTPQGILGIDLSRWIESYQSITWLSFVLIALWVKQARRLA